MSLASQVSDLAARIALQFKNRFVATDVAYSSPLTLDMTYGVINIGVLTGNLAITNFPVGTPYDGQTLRVRLVQDGTGARTVTWNAVFAFSTDLPASLQPITANANWEMMFSYHAASSKWRCLSIIRGF